MFVCLFLARNTATNRRSISLPDVKEEEDDSVSELLLTEVCEKSEFPKPHMFGNHNSFWTPHDDLTLIINMLQSCDPEAVTNLSCFTQKFTLQEIIERWHLLLRDRVTSNITIESLRQLHKSVIISIERSALFNNLEDSILKQVPSNVRFSYQNFQKLLSNNQNIFFPSREPNDLFKRWTYLHSNYLLNDQAALRNNKSQFEDIKAVVQYKDTGESTIDELEEKQIVMKKYLNSKIHEFRVLQTEIEQLVKCLSAISGIRKSQFDSNVYAYLQGVRVRFLIKNKQITLGRNTKDVHVDLDLTMEGFSKRISRFQAVINLLQNGKFMIFNSGSNDFRVNSRIVSFHDAAELFDETFLQFDNLSFIFRINSTLINQEFAARDNLRPKNV